MKKIFENKLRDLVHDVLKEKLNFPEYETNIDKWEKEDKSLVTEIDIGISEVIEKYFLELNVRFLSEENLNEMAAPVAILDPVDGTNSLVNSRKDWSVSLAYLNSFNLSDPLNEGWIYGPYYDFEISTSSSEYENSSDKENSKKLVGFVSFTEHKAGLHENKNESLELVPISSIALKLGLLAAGKCDFVISRRPKGVWDIAAGSVLCDRKGIYLWQNGMRVNSIEKLKYENDLLWCNEETYEKLSELGFK